MAPKPTAGERSATPAKRRGRRPTQDQWSKVTVVLLDHQILFLDRLASDIRAGGGAAITRAHILRALVDALAWSDVDLTTCRSETEIKAALVQYFHSSRESRD